MTLKTAGISLIILGILMMIYTGFNYSTTKKVVDIGAIQIDKETDHPVRWSPIIGTILIVGGVVVLVRGKNEKV